MPPARRDGRAEGNMSDPNAPVSRKGPIEFILRWWAFVSRPSARLSLGVLFVAGGVSGVLFWGGFNWAMESTNSMEFCISCHEMRDNVYKELQETIHFKNRSGVTAICSDCHVPHAWFYKIRRKIQASNEVLHKILGTIDTPEKFEAHRLELAQHVWDTMKSSNSRECRNCHSVEHMDPKKQSAAAVAANMPEAVKKGLTCIDCHKGIAHHLPKFPDEDEPEEKKDEKK
jgi:nitrate/TMAO reductase-like tetraheme cytochrome c subunit